MSFFRDSSVIAVLTKTLGAFLGSFAARRAKTKDGFCPILIHKFVFLRLLATSLWLTLRASLRLFKIVPDDYVCARSFLALTQKILFSKAP
jgi:hypothetical protein